MRSFRSRQKAGEAQLAIAQAERSMENAFREVLSARAAASGWKQKMLEARRDAGFHTRDVGGHAEDYSSEPGAVSSRSWHFFGEYDE